MKLTLAFATLLAAATPVFSALYVTNPVASTTEKGGKKIKIEWQDDGSAPKVDTWGGINIWLAAGSESVQYKLDQVGEDIDVDQKSIFYKIPKDIGPAGKYYFIRFESKDAAANGTANDMAFSARFELKDVTGTFNSTVLAAAQGKEGSAAATTTTGSTASTASAANKTNSTASTMGTSAANAAAAAKTSGASTSTSNSSSSTNSTSGAEALFAARSAWGTAAGIGAVAAGVAVLL